MQELTKNAISNLQRTTGHVLSVADFDDIEALDSLAEKMNGVSSVERRLLNSPFELCGIKFYPLTVAKSLWVKEKAELWDIPDENMDGFTFWILTIPLGAEALEKYETKKSADKAMRKLARRMHFTFEEINTICNRCLGVSENAQNDGKKSNTAFGGMIACLIREYGQSPEYWLYEASVEMISEMYDQILIKAMAEEDAHRQSATKNGQAKAPSATPKLRAFKAFRDKAQELSEKWSATDGNEES